MAKQPRVWDGSQWQELAVQVPNMSNYAYLPTNQPTFRNKIINGGFDIWQRGTSFSPTSGSYTSDRWQVVFDGSGATRTISQQTFTPGTAPVAGYEGTFFYRYAQSVAGTGSTYGGFQQRIEDVRTFAGQTVTVSFWAKADASRTITLDLTQSFGTGGSAAAGQNQSVSVGTSWTRYSLVFNIPSVSGKTIGTSSFLQVYFGLPINTTFTFDIWGIQLEPGSVATPFEQRPIGTELALCQRYYVRLGGSTYSFFGSGSAFTTSVASLAVNLPVQMRIKPASIETGVTIKISDQVTNYTGGTFTLGTLNSTPNIAAIDYTHTSATLTVYRYYTFQGQNDAAGYVAFSAEL